MLMLHWVLHVWVLLAHTDDAYTHADTDTHGWVDAGGRTPAESGGRKWPAFVRELVGARPRVGTFEETAFVAELWKGGERR